MPFPDYIDEKPKIIFFSDFDGTISKQDSCDWLNENEGYGYAKMYQAFQDVYARNRTYGEVSREQFDSICTPFDQCIDKVLSHVSLDEHFVAFYTWCISGSVPIIILSGGLAPLIRALLARSIGHELRGVEVVANGVVPREGFHSIYDREGAWRVQFRDDSVYGHVKARTIRPYAQHAKELPADERPILLYAGDGVSDISAAEETDLLLPNKVKVSAVFIDTHRNLPTFLRSTEPTTHHRAKDLVRYCKQRKIPFTEFRDWKDILKVTQGLYNGTIDVADVVNAALQDGDASKG